MILSDRYLEILGSVGKMSDLRCPGTLHGILSDDHVMLEVKCKRRVCGARPGVIVLHTFNVVTGCLVDTKRYAEPIRKG